MLLAIVQLATAGLLGPKLLCTHANGSRGIEWAATSCCRDASLFATVMNSETATEQCQDGCAGEGDGGLDTVLHASACDCVDEVAPGDPAVRAASGGLCVDQIDQHPLPASPSLHVIEFGIDPQVFGSSAPSRAALLAPPRAHLATIVLRI